MADEELDELDAPSPSKMPMILALVGGLVVGGGAGFAASGMAGGGGDEEGEETEEAAAKEVAVPMEVGALQINLRGSSHVARLEIAVDLKVPEGTDTESLKPRIRDQIVSVAGDYTRADIEGMAGKNRLRDELHGRMNVVLDGVGSVENVYFTQFVVQ